MSRGADHAASRPLGGHGQGGLGQGGLGHGGDAEVADVVQAALGGVGLLGAGEHLMVGHPGPQRTGERLDGGVAEGRAAPQSRHFFPGLDQPQPGVGGVQVHHVGDLPGQEPVLVERQRPGQADPAGQAARAAIRSRAVATARAPAHSTRVTERRRACGT